MKMSVNNLIDFNEYTINQIFYFLKFKIFIFIDIYLFVCKVFSLVNSGNSARSITII